MFDYGDNVAFVSQQAPSGQGIPASSASGNPVSIIDGTPARVAAMVLLSAGTLWALRNLGGLKFSSTVSVS